MDWWYSWLSKSSLHHCFVYRYSLLFSNNHLAEDDIKHFNHDLLQSMGVSVAKHRLEMLKLAEQHCCGKSKSPNPVAKLRAAMHKTKKWISKHVQSLVDRDVNSQTFERNMQLEQAMQRRLLLTDGGGAEASSPARMFGRGIPKVCRYMEISDYCTQDLRWETMFHNLKPT